MKTLHLTLKKKWFDMIESGEKPEEYREIKPYWVKRIFNADFGSLDLKEAYKYMNAGLRIAYINKSQKYQVPIFEAIHFYNGGSYSLKSPNFLRECLGIEIREGKPEWGAEPGKKYFVIKLGEKIKQ